MGIAVFRPLAVEELMLGKTLSERFLKKMIELQFGLGPQGTVEFYLGNALPRR